MSQNPDVGVLGPQVLAPDEHPQSSSWRDPALHWMALSALGLDKISSLNFERYRDRVATEPVDVECVCGAALMIRRDLFESLGGLDEDFFMYFEETDLCVRARERGMRVRHAPVGRFVHDNGGTSRSVRLRTFLDFRRSQILFHKKHGGPAHALAARGLLAVGAAVRVPPLLALAAALPSRRVHAVERLRLHLAGLRWLLDPTGGLVPDVDRRD
jgi:GT2 family glycosyltransferase